MLEIWRLQARGIVGCTKVSALTAENHMFLFCSAFGVPAPVSNPWPRPDIEFPVPGECFKLIFVESSHLLLIQKGLKDHTILCDDWRTLCGDSETWEGFLGRLR